MRTDELPEINNIHPYEKLWAILSVDKDGNEGILGMATSYGVAPAITGSPSVLEALRQQVRLDPNVDLQRHKIVVGEFIRSNTVPL